MSNKFFQFKQFKITQEKSAMKVTTDSCLFGAWLVRQVQSQNLNVKKFLDIGAGTGLLSLMFAQNVDCKLDAIELDTDAAREAKENFDASPWGERMNMINADVRTFEFLSKYDLVISNPPFYENSLKSGKGKKDSAHHDDSLLLKELIKVIAAILQPAGQFYLLLPFHRLAELELMVKENKLRLSNLAKVRQKSESSFFRILVSGQKMTDGAHYQTEEMTIKGANDEYTKEFINLLRDYYLYLDS